MSDLAAFEAAVVAAMRQAGPLGAESEALGGFGPGLGVYQNNFQASCEARLARAFPVTKQLVGAAFFQALCRSFAGGHPPTVRDLGAYGDGFAPFIAGFEAAQGTPYLSAVAELEWAVDRASRARPVEAVSLAAMGEVPAETLAKTRLVLQPCVSLLTLPYTVLSLWQNHRTGHVGAGVSVHPGPERLLVGPADEPGAGQEGGPGAIVLSLSAEHHPGVAALCCGEPLATAAEALEGDPAQLSACLALLFNHGLVKALRVEQGEGNG